MSSADDLTGLLRRISLSDTSQAQPHTQPPSRPKSFLQSMNEKLAQRPRKQRSHKQNSHGNNYPKAPLDPSQFYILENDRELLGVYSTIAAATGAAKLAGALEYYLARWVDEGIRDCGNHVRILPQKLQGIKIPAGSKLNEQSGNQDFTNKIGEEDDLKESEQGLKNEKSEGATPDSGSLTHLPATRDVTSVYVALDRSLCLGLYTEKNRAWDSCMRHKMQMTYSVDLKNEKQWVDKDGMPFLQGTIGGSGALTTECKG
ncbi:hypothetical protein N0V90_000187 [Kalmusia sp. IMI 367209]|nr:hypothetical protein N0V90_000187 [Kalmusia sp. IMI 367209]